MKEKAKKQTSKQIICIIIAIMLCNFIMPNYTYAIESNGGGTLVIDIARFACFISDVVINFLQDMFISTDEIDETSKYIIRYSPGTIFAGQIPAFSINFIGKEEEPKEAISNVYTIAGTGTEWVLSNQDFKNNYSNNYPNIKSMMNTIITEGIIRNNNFDGVVKLNGENFTTSGDISYTGEGIYLKDIFKELGIKMEKDFYFSVNYGNHSGYQTGYEADIEDTKVASNSENGGIGVTLMNVSIDGTKYENAYLTYVVQVAFTKSSDDKSFYTVMGYYGDVNAGGSLYEYNCMKITVTEDKNKGIVGVKEYKNTATILQPVIATWYNALRRVALVGLLSILVYLGIRIVLTSTSAKEKAKYKSMLKDWLVALCILFTLHYVMNITITVVDKINKIIGSSVIGENGEDVLISTIRNDIRDAGENNDLWNSILSGIDDAHDTVGSWIFGVGYDANIYTTEDNNWRKVLVQTVLYCVLGVYTVIYTIQYLRRVIYLAFLTMIAPLITLTYPLDKIKDKKSQAFDMWLKDYIFFSLIQVVHLLLYYVLVGSSMDLVDAGNWIFAIVAIGFLTKAEKIMKKMFGFEKAKSMGTMAAGATGALVVNAINQLKGIGGKKGKSGGGSSGSGESSGGNVRTATNNPLAGINPAGGSARTTGVIGTTGSSEGSSPRTTGNTAASSGGRTKKQRDIKGRGAMSVVGKYYKPVAGTALGLLTGGAGAMIGFAAGVAQGDLGAAFGGAVAGGTAGMNLGKGAVNLPGNVKDKVKTGWSNVKDTYREGAYGEEENDAERIRDKLGQFK